MLQELNLSLSRARSSLPDAVDASTDTATHSEDASDKFDDAADTTMQRIRALLDICAEDFNFNSAPGRGWSGVVDDAKARLLRSQVVDGCNISIVRFLFLFLKSAQNTGIGEPAYLHIVSSRSIVAVIV